MMVNISKDIKKRMEREFKQYWDNKKKLQELLIKSVAPTRVLLYLEQRITYIENVINNLKPFELDVFYLIFKEKCDWLYCETNYNISKSTYYNIFNKSIRLLAEEWGEI